MSPNTIPAASADEATLAPLEAATQQMPDGPTRSAFEAMMNTLRSGTDVVIGDADQQLTTTQAARYLGVSRTHFYKVLDSGVIPFTVVGTRDRRVVLADLVEYKMETDALRRRTAREAAQARESELQALDEM